MAGLPGSIQSLIPAGPDELVRRMRDLERRMDEMGPSVAPSFSPVIADLVAKQITLDAQGVTLAATVADLAAQVAFLGGQSFAYTSAKTWYLGTGTSGTGAWGIQAYDPTYDDEYVFQASSTGVLEITISAGVMLNNGSPAQGSTARGYTLSWSGGSLAWGAYRSAFVSGLACGFMQISTSASAIVTVPSNATVTLQTCRVRQSPVAPNTTWHGTQDTTVVVTRIGI